MIYLIPTDTCFGIACELTNSKSYEKIYEIKKRELSKPLAIMVENFEWLEKNTILNKAQIQFLKEYKAPFTILTECSGIQHILNYEDEEMNFPNKDIYKKIAFRVAHNEEQKKLIQNVGPIFLTSANISNDPEIFERNILEKIFEYYVKKGIVTILGNTNSEAQNTSSDIFDFEGESCEIKYVRKNSGA